MNQTASDAIAHYLSKGLSKDVATGIVAVLMVESALNPVAENNSGTEIGGAINAAGSYGLAQWNGPRQQGLLNFAKAKNEPVSAINTQLDYVLTESANSYPAVWAAMRQAGITYANFIPIFVEKYENPANPTAEIASAMTHAAEFYAYNVVASTPAPVPTPTSTPTPTPTPTSGGFTLDPVILAALEPLFDALMSSLVKAFLAQLPTTVGGTSTAPTPSINLDSLATSVAGAVIPQLATTVQSIISTELSKLVSSIPTAPKS